MKHDGGIASGPRSTAPDGETAFASGNEAPRLSVVLTVFNMGGCLQPCLDDISAQTFKDFELICIDDGSTDGSAEILEHHRISHPNTCVIRQDNAGPGAARNTGMRLAHGEMLMLLDADDRFDPLLFERLMARATVDGSDVVVCRSDEFDHKTGKKRTALWTVREELLPPNAATHCFAASDTTGCPFSAFMGWPWDKLYRTSFLRKNALAFPDLPNAEDFPFVFLALCKAQRISFVNETLIHHRTNRSGSTSASRLSAPMSFYKGIELLKSQLEYDPGQWAHLKWGFLNWALNYTEWNIQTLPAGSPQRTELIDALLGGGMPALELDQHPIEYFSLHEDTEWSILRLAKERVSGKPARMSFWELVSIASRRIGKTGVRRFAEQALAKIRNR